MAGARDRAGQALTGTARIGQVRRLRALRPSPSSPRRIGLLGGSFNPAHGGHRAISQFAIAALGLDEVWWLVSPGNPLKPRAGMASLPARFASARAQARRSRIRVTALERDTATLYTVDTLRKLVRRWPKRRFVWLMGADNLEQFSRWRNWRGVARAMPIAVIARPGYDARAFASPAMAWLRRFRMPATSLSSRNRWSAPALVVLKFNPDERSATAIRQADPSWSRRLVARRQRDGVTHHLIVEDPA